MIWPGLIKTDSYKLVSEKEAGASKKWVPKQSLGTRLNQFVTLKPTESIDVEIEATVKKNKQKFSIELSWREVVTLRRTEESFRTSSQVPEPVPQPEEESEPEALEEEAEAEADSPARETDWFQMAAQA